MLTALQDSGDFNTSYQEQYGNNNTASVIQHGIFFGFGNAAIQYQYGYDNLFTSLLDGDLNKSYQEQYGNTNIAKNGRCEKCNAPLRDDEKKICNKCKETSEG